MKFKSFLVAASLMLLSVGAFAQSYNRVQIGYSSVSQRYDGKSISGQDPFKGVTLGYVFGMGITDALPIYLEYGANLSLNFNKYEDSYSEPGFSASYETKTTYVNLAVPVNGVYKISFNDDMSLVPYAGINFKFNLIGKDKETETYGGESNTETYKWFSGEGDGKRLQFGGQIGCGFNYKQYYVGYQIQRDFTEIFTNTKMVTNTISVGYTF